MAIEEILYLSLEEAVSLHLLLMREWREVRFGIDRKDLLELALNRNKHRTLKMQVSFGKPRRSVSA